MIGDTLGEDAVIVATREERNSVGGSLFHVTAAIDPDSTAAADGLGQNEELPSSDWMYEDDSDESMVLEELTEAMLRHGVPDEILDQIVSTASVMSIDEPRPALLAAIESLFKFTPLPTMPGNRPLMMIGPPGAGKTLATAKLAARASMAGMSVEVITTDMERAGGREQLEAFTKLMDIDLKAAKSSSALKEMLLAASATDLVIIDTAGSNPFDTTAMKNLASLIGAIDVDPVLVIPAGTHPEEAGEMAQIYATIGAQRFLPSRVDVARRLGSMLCAAYQGGLAFTDVSATAQVADGLSSLTPKRLTQLLMPRVERAKIPNAQKANS